MVVDNDKVTKVLAVVGEGCILACFSPCTRTCMLLQPVVLAASEYKNIDRILDPMMLVMSKLESLAAASTPPPVEPCQSCDIGYCGDKFNDAGALASNSEALFAK
jgi:hypothetical protein